MNYLFVRRPIFAICLAIVTLLLGGVAITNLSIEQYPDITPPTVEVTTTYTGADATTVDAVVATPLGEGVMGVSDMLYMQSTSANDGTMTLQVVFDIGTDPDLDAIFTQNNVASATSQLPSTVVTQGVVTKKSMSGFLQVFALHSDRYDRTFLSNYAYINLQNQLLKLQGVGKVSIMGAGEYAMRIWVRPEMLNYYNISLDELRNAVLAESTLYPTGQFGAEPTTEPTVYTYTVTLPQRISTAEEFASIVVKSTSAGEQIFLRDVASVELGCKSYGAGSAFESSPSTLLVVYQEPGSNAVEVGKRVKSSMQQFAARFPEGMSYAVLVDATQSIVLGVKEIVWTLLLALALVVLIIYLFLREWRSTLIPLVAIPVSIVGTFLFFPLLGFSINIISLLGLVLAIGLVVDDAIVVVEATQANLDRGLEPRQAATEAMRQVALPIVATTVVLLAVFVPMALSGGVSGRLFQQFAVTISVSVVLSSFNALTLSPALCALLLRRREPTATSAHTTSKRSLAQRFMQSYLGRVEHATRHTLRVVLLLAVTLVATALCWRALPQGFLPEEDQGYLTIMVETPQASALPVTQVAMQAAEQLVGTLPEVEYISYAAGFNMMAGIAETNSGVLFVKLVDYNRRKRTAMQLATQLNGMLYEALPQATAYAFVPPAIPGLGVSSGVSLMVQDLSGRDIDYLSDYTDRLITQLEKQAAIDRVTTTFNSHVPQRLLTIDKAYALREGVALSEMYDVLSSCLGGSYIGNFNRFGKLYQIYLAADAAYRIDARSLDNYYVQNGDGESVPLSAFVSVRDTVGATYLSRFNLYRAIPLNLSVKEGFSSRQAMQAAEQVAREVLPTDIDIAWSGSSLLEQQDSSNTTWLYLLSLFIVFLTLASLYESWSLPTIILLSTPPALLGAFGAMWIAHHIAPQLVNDIYMRISIVMLIGLAAKNAILVVEYAERLVTEQHLTVRQAAIEAARIRVRPILMTAFAFVLGVLPLVFAHGVYATARNTLGIALCGGMLLATLVGVVIYPALFYLVAHRSGLDKQFPKQ
jgi:HAE1 family hydrophobic/amphiphilic exporter-1